NQSKSYVRYVCWFCAIRWWDCRAHFFGTSTRCRSNVLGSGHALDQLDDSLRGLFDWESDSHFKSE
ncbi:MAG TPA: hypothetical protein VJ323_20235, partial [Bryobacteraceae bacterium]|nr:hypothetical protein [Bryobacteraceae bacterium]